MTFVYIVEAPGAHDIFDGRTEGEALSHSLKLAELGHAHRMVVDRAQLKRALSLDQADGGLGAELVKRERHQPIIHLSMHGNKDGVQLTSREFVTWAELRAELDPINDALPLGVLVCLSSCSGYSAIRMSMHTDGRKPLWGVVGSTENILWNEGLIAYATFYHHWFRNSPHEETMIAMRAASGRQSFFMENGAKTAAEYLAYVSSFAPAPSVPGGPLTLADILSGMQNPAATPPANAA